MIQHGVRRVAAIDYRCTPYDWAFARDEAAGIDRFWTAALAEKPALFDGRVLMAHQLAVEPDGDGLLRASGFETGYKPFLAWREFGFPGASLANLFAMAALRSRDGAFMLGQMSAGTTSAGRLYFPAGTPEPCDVRDGLVDLQGNVLRELEEETGLTAADVVLDPGWVVVFDGARVACMKPARCHLGAAALAERVQAFRATQAEPELMLTFLRGAFAEGLAGA